jgi:hypothetical protein
MENKKISLLLQDIYRGIDLEKSVLERIDPDVFDLVDILISELEYDGLMNEILDNSNEPDLRKIGVLVDILCWQTPDNGSYLFKQIAEWVRSNDRIKVEIALGVSDFYPIDPSSAFKQELHRIESKFPALKARCLFWRESIENQEKRDA